MDNSRMIGPRAQRKIKSRWKSRLWLVALLVLGLGAGCKKQDNQSQQVPMAKVRLQLKGFGLGKQQAVVNVSGSAMISVVDSSVTSVTNTTLLNAYDQNMEDMATQSVFLFLPIGQPVRLVESGFYVPLTLLDAQLQQVSDTIGLSQPFTVTAVDSQLSVQIIPEAAPDVLAFTPAEGATGVKVGSVLSVEFTNPMDPASLSVMGAGVGCVGTIQLSTDNFVTCVAIDPATTLSPDGRVLSFAPVGGLDYSTQYKIKVTADGWDQLGNQAVFGYTAVQPFITEDFPGTMHYQATGLISGQIYYWRVTATDANGVKSSSTVRSFSVF